MHSVGIESTKLIFVGTRITYQATGDAGVPLFDHFPLSFFLRGLRWHLSGLSELPLEQCLFLLLAGESFPFSIRFSKSHFFPTLCFCGPFFCTMYGHVVEHLLLCILQYRQHSAAQHGAISPHKAAKQVRADRSATTQASRQKGYSVLQYRKHSTQHIAVSAHKVAKQVRADQSATTPASKEHLLCSIAALQAQYSAISPHKAAKQARADQSATTQASRQSWREPAHVVEHLYSMLSSQNERRY